MNASHLPARPLHLVQPASSAPDLASLRGHAHCNRPRAMRTLLTLALVSSLAAAGCEKANHKSSGPLGDDDLAMLRDLPGGNIALIGGNYMKMQNFMQSALGQFAEDAMEKAGAGKGFKDWMACFAEMKGLKIAGGVAMSAGIEMRLVFKGMSIDQIDGCAKRAGFTHTLDPDHKYVEIEVPGALDQTFSQGYLALPDGTVYNRQRIAISILPSVESASRSDLEADEKNLSTSNATNDKPLLALAGKADRSKTFWFAGSGAHTPAADKIGDVYGSLDIDGGLKADVTVGFTDKAMAKQLEDGFDEAKKMSNSLPAEIRSLLEDMSLHRDGGSVHIVAKLSDAQLKSLTRLGGLGGGLN
jgi:hypothetical protein